MNCHERLKHEGVDHVWNELRQQYWLLRCCATVQKILHQCSYCQSKSKTSPTHDGSLPYDRLQIAPTFSKAGVDFFGPLKVKHLVRKQAASLLAWWQELSHLKVAFSLSTDSFIMCLRQFIAGRGKPTVIYSDNGTNFVGANCECINDWNQDTIGSVLSQDGIQWVFNPPAMPRMGGIWKRLVRVCKAHWDASSLESTRVCVVHSSEHALLLSISTNVLTESKELKSNQVLHFVSGVLKTSSKTNIKIILSRCPAAGRCFKKPSLPGSQRST